MSAPDGFAQQRMTPERNPPTPAQTPPYIPPARPPRAPIRFSFEERKAMQPFRAQYTATSEVDVRHKLLIHHIFPAIFEHWRTKGDPPKTDPEFKIRWRLVAEYCRNNWRKSKDLRVNQQAKIVVRMIDIVREEFPERVEANIRELTGVSSSEQLTSKEYLAVLNKAVSLVSQGLSADEARHVETIRLSRTTAGLPPEKQREQFMKHGRKLLRQAHATHWLQLGVLQFTMTATKDAKGKWTIEAHDFMAKLMGVTADPFESLFEAEVACLQSKLLSYVCHLTDTKNPRALKTQNEIPSRPDLQVLLDDAGYPIMPDRPVDKQNQLKKELAMVMRKYLNAHYKLASAHKTETAPFTKVASETASYIDPEYLPAGYTFRDPANVQKEEIAAFIEHIQARQHEHPLHQVFKWKAYQIDRKGTLAPARYGEYGDPDLRAKKAETQRVYREGVRAKQAEVNPMAAKPTETDRPWRADGMEAHYDRILAENTSPANSNRTDTGDATEVDMPGPMQSIGTHHGRPRTPVNGNLQTPPPDSPTARHGKPLSGGRPSGPDDTIEVTQEVYHRVRELNPGLIIAAHNGPASGQLPQHHIPKNLYDAWLVHSASPPVNDGVPDDLQEEPRDSTPPIAGVPPVPEKAPRGRGRPPGKRQTYVYEDQGADVAATTANATGAPEGRTRRSLRHIANPAVITAAPEADVPTRRSQRASAATQRGRATALPHNQARGRGRRG